MLQNICHFLYLTSCGHCRLSCCEKLTWTLPSNENVAAGRGGQSEMRMFSVLQLALSQDQPETHPRDLLQKIPCSLFTLIASTHHFLTSDLTDLIMLYQKPTYFVIDIWRLITLLSNNIFERNFFHRHSESTVRNSVEICWDLTVLSYIVYSVTIFPDTVYIAKLS